MSGPAIAEAERAPFSPVAAIFVGVGAASTASLFIRFAQLLAPSLVIAAYRLGIATAVLIPIALLRYRSHLATLRRSDVMWMVLSGLFLAVHFGTWITSLAYTSVASSVVLVSMAPLFVALLSPWALREPVTRRVAFGIVLATIGTLGIAASDACRGDLAAFQCPEVREALTGQALKGDLLALVGAAAVAGYMMIGRRLRGHLSLIPYITVTYGVAALGLITAAVLAGHPLGGYPPRAYLWFALLAVFPQLLAHSTYNWALRYLPAAFVSISLLGEPVGSTLLAYLFLAETPSTLKLLGAGLILAAIIIATLRPQAAAHAA